jgi:hypothetical protein
MQGFRTLKNNPKTYPARGGISGTPLRRNALRPL